MSISYPYSNESLDAVMKGMDVKSNDDILAVLGSGDMAFAMLEYADSVLAVDYDKEQVEYAKQRAEALKAGNYDGFFPDCSDQEGNSWNKQKNIAIEYFSRDTLIGRMFKGKSRLGKIRSKLGSIEFRATRLEDFVRDIQGRKFSKAYLSNAFTHGMFHGMSSKHRQRDFIQMLEAKLRNPGIIYLADGQDFNIKHLYNAEEDRKLTEIALELEKDSLWAPMVYRRRA